jgi:hypothetical protein
MLKKLNDKIEAKIFTKKYKLLLRKPKKQKLNKTQKKKIIHILP